MVDPSPKGLVVVPFYPLAAPGRPSLLEGRCHPRKTPTESLLGAAEQVEGEHSMIPIPARQQEEEATSRLPLGKPEWLLPIRKLPQAPASGAF